MPVLPCVGATMLSTPGRADATGGRRDQSGRRGWQRPRSTMTGYRAGAGSIRHHPGADTQQIPGGVLASARVAPGSRPPHATVAIPAAASSRQRDFTAGLALLQDPAGGCPGDQFAVRRVGNLGLPRAAVRTNQTKACSCMIRSAAIAPPCPTNCATGPCAARRNSGSGLPPLAMRPISAPT